MNSLRFTNGQLDTDFIYQQVKNKQNIYCEILCIKHALKPYHNIISTVTNIPTVTGSITHACEGYNLCERIRLYYNKIIRDKIIPPYQEYKWRRTLEQPDLQFKDIYIRKIKNVAEIKIRDFNFKVLHMILPCGQNLKRWGKRNFDTCQICNVTHDIPHLLYNCTKARRAWDIFRQVSNVSLSLNDIIISDFQPEMYTLVSLYSYLIYKEWLVHNEEKYWKNTNILTFMKWELKNKAKIYDNLGGKWQEMGNLLQNTIICVENAIE